MIERTAKQVIIEKMTEAQYAALTEKDPTHIYLTPDAPASTTNLGPVKVDGTTITAATDGTISAASTGPTVVQTTGTSTTDVMSQNAVTAIIGNVETLMTTLISGGGAQ